MTNAEINIALAEACGYERKVYMLGLSVMSRLKREDRFDGDTSHLDPSVLDSIIYDAIDLGLIKVSDKGEIIFQ